jgi:hypothetical protein
MRTIGRAESDAASTAAAASSKTAALIPNAIALIIGLCNFILNSCSSVCNQRERPDYLFAPAPARLANTSLATGAEKAFGQPA